MSSVARRIVGLARESLSMERAMEQMASLSRRRLLRALAATGAAALCRPQLASSQQARVFSKPRVALLESGSRQALAEPAGQ